MAISFIGHEVSISSTNSNTFTVSTSALTLVSGDVLHVSVTTDATTDAGIDLGAGHSGVNTNVYNFTDITSDPRKRDDIIVYTGSAITLDYELAGLDAETWHAIVSQWRGVDNTTPVPGSSPTNYRGDYEALTNSPTAQAITAPAGSGYVAVTSYGQQEDDFDTNGEPTGYTKVAISASGGGTLDCSGGVAYRTGISAGAVAAADWTTLAAEDANITHFLLNPASDASIQNLLMGANLGKSLLKGANL